MSGRAPAMAHRSSCESSRRDVAAVPGDRGELRGVPRVEGQIVGLDGPHDAADVVRTRMHPALSLIHI